jgi:hypothetical protein
MVWLNKIEPMFFPIGIKGGGLRLPGNRMGGKGKRVRIAVTPRCETERASARRLFRLAPEHRARAACVV